MPYPLALASMRFDNGRGLRRDQADDASIGRKEARHPGLAGVLTGPEKSADEDDDAQYETRRDPQGDGTGQLDSSEPRLSVAFEDFASEEVGH